MGTFIIKLAVTTIPMIVLIGSVVLLSTQSKLKKLHTFSRHRKRRSVLRALSDGAMLR